MILSTYIIMGNLEIRTFNFAHWSGRRPLVAGSDTNVVACPCRVLATVYYGTE
jgi:hypothetical protein